MRVHMGIGWRGMLHVVAQSHTHLWLCRRNWDSDGYVQEDTSECVPFSCDIRRVS